MHQCSHGREWLRQLSSPWSPGIGVRERTEIHREPKTAGQAGTPGPRVFSEVATVLSHLCKVRAGNCGNGGAGDEKSLLTSSGACFRRRSPTLHSGASWAHTRAARERAGDTAPGRKASARGPCPRRTASGRRGDETGLPGLPPTPASRPLTPPLPPRCVRKGPSRSELAGHPGARPARAPADTGGAVQTCRPFALEAPPP